MSPLTTCRICGRQIGVTRWAWLGSCTDPRGGQRPYRTAAKGWRERSQTAVCRSSICPISAVWFAARWRRDPEHRVLPLVWVQGCLRRCATSTLSGWIGSVLKRGPATYRSTFGRMRGGEWKDWA